MELLPRSGSVWGALLLTTLAGAATAAGAGAAFFTRRTNTRFLSVALGLSGGVMIYISFVELLAGANTALREAFGGRTGAFAAIAAFFGGMLTAGIIDRLVPEPVNPHETKSLEEMNGQAPPDSAKLHRAGIRFAAAIAIHKFPEGLAVFAASLTGLELGIPVALAMALHNIPEGIAVSVPVYYATGSRAKAFWYASLTGLADPAGDALHRAAEDLDLVARHQFAAVRQAEELADGIDFGLSHLGRTAVEIDNPRDAVGAGGAEEVFGRSVNENVGVEEGHIDVLHAVGPRAWRAVQRQPDVEPLLAEASLDLLLRPGMGVKDKPREARGT